MGEHDNKNGIKIILNKSTNPSAIGTYFICFTMVLFPDSPAPVGTERGGGETGECQLRGMGRGLQSMRGVGAPGHTVVPTPGPGLPWGKSGGGTAARVEGRGWLPRSLPSRSNFTSLAALMPSSLRFFSIALLRSRAALSSALRVHPMVAPSLPQPARLGWHDSPGRRAPHPPKEQSLGSKGEKSRYPLLGWEQNCRKTRTPQKRQPLSRFQRRRLAAAGRGLGVSR